MQTLYGQFFRPYLLMTCFQKARCKEDGTPYMFQILSFLFRVTDEWVNKVAWFPGV